MKTPVFIWMISLLAPTAVFGQQPSPNIRIYPSGVTQTEPVVAVSPTNPNFLFASAFTINTTTTFRSEGVYTSTNGGMTWTGSDTCGGQLLANHGGDPGVMVQSDGRLVLTHIGQLFPGLYSHFSTDNGLTWSAAYTITSSQPEDKGSSTSDHHSGSPFYGRLYAAWVSLVVPFPVSFSFSSNSGSSWTSPVPINPTPPARCSGGSIATGSAGDVYVAWSGMTSSAPFIEDFAGFASSSDGGGTWEVHQSIFDMNGINGTLASKGNIRVNGLPQIAVDNSAGPRSGWLYVVTNEKNIAPAGSDPDVILHRSTNNGATWSSGIRVNQDAFNNGKIQYLPAMEVDDEGGINILFYDDRFTTADSAEVMLARSLDGGATWIEATVSDHRFKPKPIIGGASSYQGDHIALKAVGTVLHALWMDDFAGLYQVWHSIIDLKDTSIPDNPMSQAFRLDQNYPNPFNPVTMINFSVGTYGHTSLQVFDILGREVATLVDGKHNAGDYSVEFNAAGLASGVYIYRLIAGSESLTRMMFLAK